MTLLCSLSFVANTAIASESSARHLIKLAKPNGVTATPSSTSIAVFFNPVVNATSYTVRVYIGRGEQIVGFAHTNFNSGDLVTNLTPLTKYKITVQAIGNGIRFSNSESSGELKVTTTSAVLSCADGGTCGPGDAGPGAGTVFYYSSTGFSCGQTFSTTGSPTSGLCHYLEVAPSGWNTGTDPLRTWAIAPTFTDSVVPGLINDPSPNNTSAAIGVGYLDSLAIVLQGNDSSTAAGLAQGYAGGTKTDWYLPSEAELNQLCKFVSGQSWISDETVCTGSATPTLGFVAGTYWASSGGGASFAWDQSFLNGNQSYNTKVQNYYVRPIRAF